VGESFPYYKLSATSLGVVFLRQYPFQSELPCLDDSIPVPMISCISRESHSQPTRYVLIANSVDTLVSSSGYVNININL
jgi:hypothetical protein